MASTHPDGSVNISDYILDKFVAAKVTPPALKVVYDEPSKHQKSSTEYLHGQQRCTNLTLPFARSPVASVSISEASMLVEANAELNTKRVWELTLDRSAFSAEINYEPGDTIAILPSNTQSVVQRLLRAMRIEATADRSCRVRVLATTNTKVKTAKVPPYIPETTTPREMLRDCLNVQAVPKKQFLSALAECCAPGDERDFLNCLSSKEASAHYNALFLDKGLTLVHLLELCPSCKPSMELLIENLPRLLPRPYSVANSPLLHKGHLKIIFSLHNEKPGITTSMLAKLAASMQPHTTEPPPKVLAYFREANKFRYTADDASANQILIGVGTGLAPFIGFLQHKQQLKGAAGATWLFAGATTEDSVVHRDTLIELRTAGVLDKYYESLSRVPDAPYHYVQEQLDAHCGAFVEFLLQPQTTLYLCADGAHISKAIQAAVAGCIQRHLQMAEIAVMEMIKGFRASGKYREDLWI